MIEINHTQQIFHRLKDVARSDLPWLDRLERLCQMLVDVYPIDAVWLLTMPPLPVAAAGLVSLTPAGKAISLSDSHPPLAHILQTSVIGQVAQSGQAMYGQNLLTDADYVDSDLADTLLAFSSVNVRAIVPLQDGDTCIGIIIAGGHRVDGDSSPDVEQSIPFIAQHLAMMLSNANLTTIARRQAQQLQSLNRIARTIASSLDLDEVLHHTIVGLDEVLDVEAGSLLLIDPNTDELYFRMVMRGAHNIINTYRLKPGEGIAGWVAQNQESTLVNNVSADPRFSRRIDESTGFRTRSVMCSPVIVNDKVIGVLEVLNKRNGLFTADDQSLLTTITDALGIALYNARLYQQLQVEAKRAENTKNLISAANSKNSYEETLEFVVCELRRLFDFDAAIVTTLDDSETNLQHIVLNNTGDILERTPLEPVEGSVLEELAVRDECSTCYTFPVTLDAPQREIRMLARDGYRSGLAVLLESEDTLVGALTLTSRTVHNFPENCEEEAEQLSSALSIVLDKARFMDALTQRNAELEELNLMGERLLARTDPDFILETALEYLSRILPADVHGMALDLPDYTKLQLRMPKNATPAMVDKVRQDMLDSLQYSQAREQTLSVTGEAVIYENTEVGDDWELKSNLAWPILTLHGTLGVVYLGYGYSFKVSTNLMRMFSLVVSRIAGAVENVRLFKEVEQERARLSAILASTPDGILVVNKNGRIILDNPAAYRTLGYTESQRGKALVDVTDHKALLELFQTSDDHTNPPAIEFVNAEEKVFYASVSPVKIGEDAVIGWVAVLQDITYFKELNEAKDNLVNVISHDLRSPLATILISSQLMGEVGELNEQQADMLRIIETHIDHMAELIDDLLNIGKIEANIDMEMTAHPLMPILRDSISQIRPQAEHKQIEFALDADSDSVIINCNESRLQQVLNNLIGNAVKYTPEGGKVTVTTRSDGEQVQVRVIDTGVGIPQKDLPHIFEKFYRVRGDHMLGIKGTGLGLAIVRSIVEKHNGRVWVESEFGDGSVFTLTLPLLQTETA